MNVAELDFVCKAPDGKEVEELTKKEIHKALRGQVASEQAKMEKSQGSNRTTTRDTKRTNKTEKRNDSREIKSFTKKRITTSEKKTFNDMLEDLIGTRGAYVLDEKLNILGKVPVSELQSTIKSLRSGIYAVVLDGVIDKDLVLTAERAYIRFLVAMESNTSSSKVTIVSSDDL
jgi:DNA primase